MLLLLLILAMTATGCSDDDAAISDAGPRDAQVPSGGHAGARDAWVPPGDARVPDASHDGSTQDASAAGDARDAGHASTCDDLALSYIWANLACVEGEGLDRTARRVTLDDYCKRFNCPADWDAALALADAAGCGESDAGSDELCWSATRDCGANLFWRHGGNDETFLYYDDDGKLIGAAVQLSDVMEGCEARELIAGEEPPLCCEFEDGGA